MNNSWQFVFFKIFVFIRVYSCIFMFLKKLLSIDVPVVDGL